MLAFVAPARPAVEMDSPVYKLVNYPQYMTAYRWQRGAYRLRKSMERYQRIRFRVLVYLSWRKMYDESPPMEVLDWIMPLDLPSPKTTPAAVARPPESLYDDEWVGYTFAEE